MCSSTFKEINAMKMNRLLTAVFALVFITFSSQAVAQDQNYKIYEIFYDDLEQTESLANNNDAFAQYILAIACEFGDGVDVDLSRAADLYKKSAENGNGIAQYHLSEIYFDGGLLPVNLKKGIYWLKQASNKNIRGAMSGLNGLAASGGRGYYPDKSLAYEFCVKRHRLFDNSGIDVSCYLSSDLEKKAIKEASWIETLFAKGIGNLPDEERELKSDADDFYRKYIWSKAGGYVDIEALRKSAQKGSRRGMGDLADVYSGLGDYKTALDWYLKGARLGDSGAMHRLGEIYSKETMAGFVDVSRNLKEAKKYRLLAALNSFPGNRSPVWVLNYMKWDHRVTALLKAAEAGNTLAMYEVHNEGDLHFTDKQRISLLEKAANQGYVPAMGRLAKNYFRGRYVLQNYTKAYKWLLLSHMAKPSSPDRMKKGVDKLKEEMDKASINEAQHMAAAWLEDHPNFIE
jgi:uncharacterized protein